VDPAELGGLLRGADADHRETYARGVEVLPGAMQLHRVLAAENSAVVAQEYERGRPILPEVAKPHVLSGVVLEDDVLQIARVNGWVRRLPSLDRV